MTVITDEIAEAHGIGRRHDSEVAQALGVTRQAVHMYRRKRGIPPASPGHSHPGPRKRRDIEAEIACCLATFPGGITARGVARQCHVRLARALVTLRQVGVLREGRWYAR